MTYNGPGTIRRSRGPDLDPHSPPLVVEGTTVEGLFSSGYMAQHRGHQDTTCQSSSPQPTHRPTGTLIEIIILATSSYDHPKLPGTTPSSEATTMSRDH